MRCRTSLRAFVWPILVVMLMLTHSMVAQQTPGLEIHVYPDNAVKLVFNYTQTIEYPVHGYAELKAKLYENRVIISLDLAFKSLAQNLYTRQDMRASLSMSFTSTPQDSVVKGRGRVELNFTSYEGSISVRADNIEFYEHVDKLLSNIYGKAKVTASGAAAQIIPYLSALPFMIRPMLQQAEATFINVKELSVTPEGMNAVTISFNIEINGTQALRQWGLDEQDIRRGRAYQTNFSIIMVASGSGIDKLRLDLDIGANANTLLKDVAEYLGEEMPHMPTAYRTVYSIMPGTYTDIETLNRILRMAGGVVVKEFTNTFAIMPSEAAIRMTTRDSRYAEFSIETPKIVKINASSPADTLKALYSYALSVGNSLQAIGMGAEANITSESLLRLPVTLVPKENVKIMLNNTTATNVAFEDIPKLQVEVETGVTKTPPSKEIPVALVVAVVVVAVAGIAIAVILVKVRR